MCQGRALASRGLAGEENGKVIIADRAPLASRLGAKEIGQQNAQLPSFLSEEPGQSLRELLVYSHGYTHPQHFAVLFRSHIIWVSAPSINVSSAHWYRWPRQWHV